VIRKAARMPVAKSVLRAEEQREVADSTHWNPLRVNK
jgi:hypothetical protein